MIEISKNVKNPSVTLFELGTQVERAASVLYVHKCFPHLLPSLNIVETSSAVDSSLYLLWFEKKE